jgi:hypothetical protein
MGIVSINRGTDFDQVFEYQQENGAPLDLTGHTFSVFEPSAEFDGLISIAETDLAAGLITVRIDWVDTFSSSIKHSFRIRAHIGANDVGTPLVEVIYT